MDDCPICAMLKDQKQKMLKEQEQKNKPLTRKDIPNGAFYSHWPEPAEHVFMAIGRNSASEKAFLDEWRERVIKDNRPHRTTKDVYLCPGDVLSVTYDGTVVKVGPDDRCFIVDRPPKKRDKEYLDALVDKRPEFRIGSMFHIFQKADHMPKPTERKVIPTGWFFSHNPQPDAIRFLALATTPEYEKDLNMELGKDRFASLGDNGDLYWSGADDKVYPRGEDTPLAKKLVSDYAAKRQKKRDVKRKDITNGTFFTFTKDGDKYLAVERDHKVELDYLAFYNRQNLPTEDYLFSLDQLGRPSIDDRNNVVYPANGTQEEAEALLANMEKRVQALGPRITAEQQKICPQKVCRRDGIKSGQFFWHAQDQHHVYLAIERNADTEFYYKALNRYPSSHIINPDHLFCLREDGQILLTSSNYTVTPCEDRPDLKKQLVSIYCDNLKTFCHNAHVEPAGLPLYFDEPNFFSPLTCTAAWACTSRPKPKKFDPSTHIKNNVMMSDQAVQVAKFHMAKTKSADRVWCVNMEISPEEASKRFKSLETRPDLHGLSAKMSEALQQRHESIKQMDVVDRLYQDQLDYYKREEQKAKDEAIRSIQKQLATSYAPPESDNKMDDKRKASIASMRIILSRILCLGEDGHQELLKLERHGWGTASVQEEKALREAVTEMKTFLKAWKKKHQNTVYPPK
jgi:hypothetical protein